MEHRLVCSHTRPTLVRTTIKNLSQKGGIDTMAGAQDAMRTLKSPHDRFCTECGFVIRGQAVDKLRVCPYKGCKQAVVLMSTPFEPESGWGRCRSCVHFIHRDFSFCQACGLKNEPGWFRKRRLEKEEREWAIEEVKRLRQSEETKKKEMNKLREENESLKKALDDSMTDDEMSQALDDVEKRLSQSPSGENKEDDEEENKDEGDN